MSAYDRDALASGALENRKGGLWLDAYGRVYVLMAADHHAHIEAGEIFLDVSSGESKHWSKLAMPIKPVHGSEVCW